MKKILINVPEWWDEKQHHFNIELYSDDNFVEYNCFDEIKIVVLPDRREAGIWADMLASKYQNRQLVHPVMDTYEWIMKILKP